MIHGLYQSAAGMMTNEYRQNVLANNLANAETIGFKRQIATFAERVPAVDAGRRDGASAEGLAALPGGLWLGQTHTDFSEGNAIRTENPLDIALNGPGFLMVEAGGERLFTRDGRLLMDIDGRLMATSDGASILGFGGGPIYLDPRGGQPTIDEEGAVLQGGRRVGQLALVDFANYDLLQHAGEGRFRSGASSAPSAARVMSGFVESSSVEAVKELVVMMESSRAYQLNARMVQLQDDSVGRLLSVVARP